MLINLSNHPSKEWNEFQRKTALDAYKSIFDMDFPNILPEISEIQITQLAQNFVKQILKLKPLAVHIMGEMNFTHKCVTILKAYDINCIASTTVRNSTENENIKTSHFEFVQFREY